MAFSRIKNAFKTRTKKGLTVFRIRLDMDEILSNIEQGNNVMAIDVCTNKYGEPAVQSGNGKKGAYKALNYYTWSMRGDINAPNEINKIAPIASS